MFLGVSHTNLRFSRCEAVRILKYGLVGCAGIVVNLGTLALFLTLGFQRGWTSSAIATVVSASGNFILHNLWTFSDRQYCGLRLVRGFLFFALVSVIGITTTTAFYVGLSRIATHLTIVNSHRSTLGTPLACQLAAILLSAGVSYLLNGYFTWPRLQGNGSADLTQLQET